MMFLFLQDRGRRSYTAADLTLSEFDYWMRRKGNGEGRWRMYKE